MTARRWAALLCAVLALAQFGCSGAGDAVTRDPSTAAGPAFADVEPSAITIGVVAGGDALPLIVAERGDLFSGEGTVVRIARFESAEARDAALTAGEIDALVGGLASAAALEAAGTPVAIVSLVADVSLIPESTSTPTPDATPDAFGLGEDSAYLVVSDRYLALPSGLLATRAVLSAVDAAVVRVQADPAAYRDLLAQAVGRDDVVIAGGAYRASSSPGVAHIEQQLLDLSVTHPEIAGVASGDLVLDIGR